MKKLSWLTDIHINFLDEERRFLFYKSVKNTQADAVIISGDIAEGNSVCHLLTEMESVIQKPIYFVLGNHDYYKSDVATVKKALTQLTKKNKNLIYLASSGPIQLGKNTILVGQDGWADGRLGDYANSGVRLNDSRYIQDLFHAEIKGKYPLLGKMQELADKDAAQLKTETEDAIKKYQPEKIMVVTHVPPFKESCLYQNKISGDDFLPFFGCKIMGEILTEVALKNKEIQFDVLCGHTHGEARYQALDNLLVNVGGAEYMQPEVQAVISV